MSLLEVEQALVDTVERLKASVVRIERAPGPEGARDDAFSSGGLGSGVVVDRAGTVVTNDHVVRGAPQIAVTFPDGARVPGRLLGEDPLTDLAVVRVDHATPYAARLGDSSSLRAGQFVVAIGNALGLPGEATVSFGVVSALHRPLPGSDFVFEGLLQTDAAINPGNSGGPLATLTGEVIGVTTAIVPFAQGVGFAVPSATVRRVLEHLDRHGRVVRPWLGLSLAPLEARPRSGARERTTGLVVAEVVRGGPAHDAGVRPGDVLFRVGSTGVRKLRDVLETLAGLPIGGEVELALARGGDERVARLRVAEAPRRDAVGRRVRD